MYKKAFRLTSVPIHIICSIHAGIAMKLDTRSHRSSCVVSLLVSSTSSMRWSHNVEECDSVPLDTVYT